MTPVTSKISHATAEGLVLSEVIYGNLDLRSLLRANGLIFPKAIYGNLILSSLITTEGLRLPEMLHSEVSL
jgi:hypothetical protein